MGNRALFSRSARNALALAILLAGSLDLSYALIVSALRGTAPGTVLQGIASGLLGPQSFSGGVATALLGGALHYAIMAFAVAGYFVLRQRAPFARLPWWLCGLAFGTIMFAIMNYVVVPLSAIGHVISRKPLLFAGELFSHLVFVGLTTAWFAERGRRLVKGPG